MARSAALHDRLQDLSEHLGRRLVLTDERLHVLGYSSHESEADRARLSVILAHSDSWPIPPSTSTEHVQAVSGHGWVRLVALRDHAQVVGFLLIPCDRGDGDMGKSAEDELGRHRPLLVQMLSERAARAQRDRARCSTLVRDLVGEAPLARMMAGAALVEEGKLGLAPRYSAVALGLKPALEGATELARRAVDLTIEYAARTSTVSLVGGVLDDGTGVLVFPRPVVEERLLRVFEHPELREVRAGIGPLVDDLVQVRESYLRSRDAWLVNMSTRATRRVSVWDNLGVDRLLVRAASGLREEDLPEPVLQIIRARLGDELLQTLRSYLAHGGDVAVTVGTLHIHRSTLYYRLGRIRDLSGVDVADAHLRAELTIGLRMAELGGHGIPD